MSLLQINGLSVQFGGCKVIEDIDLTVHQGEIVGLVGESGSGKSVTMLAVMGLLAEEGQVSAERMLFNGQDLRTMSARQRRRLLGRDIAMIFQDPMTALNPSLTVGYQIQEVLRVHQRLRGQALKRRALELMDQVEIPAAAARLAAYPHQLSGGMNQRIAMAMAIACNPKLLIADEPTTALDVTIQAQMMELLLHLQHSHDMALILISHDLAVMTEVAQRVVVMYAGQVVEQGTIPAIFDAPLHPYTQALLAAIPEYRPGARRLTSLPGIVPGHNARPQGCLLVPRCPYVADICHRQRPILTSHVTGAVRCHFPAIRKEKG